MNSLSSQHSDRAFVPVLQSTDVDRDPGVSFALAMPFQFHPPIVNAAQVHQSLAVARLVFAMHERLQLLTDQLPW